MALLSKNKVLVERKTERDRLHQKGFGEMKERKLVLDLFEALYLCEKGKIKIEDEKGKKASEKEIEKRGARIKDFHSKYAVYYDLKEKGYCAKTGFKFGFDFRVYPKGKKVGEAHSQWVVGVSGEDTRISMTEISRMVRLAQNIRTTMLLAVVDSEDEVNYYEAKRIVP